MSDIKMSAVDFAKFELLDIEFVHLYPAATAWAVKRKHENVWLRTNPRTMSVRIFANPENNIDAVLRWVTQPEYWC